MFFRPFLLVLLAFAPCWAFSQRYLPAFESEDAQKLFDKAEKAYVKGNYERSARLYANLMEIEGESYQLIYNRLTSLIRTRDTAEAEVVFKKLIDSPFHDYIFLSTNKDFKQLKYRYMFQLWQNAVKMCSERETKSQTENPIQLPKIRSQLLFMKVADVTSDVQVVHKLRYDGYPDVSYDSLRTLREKIYRDNFTQLLKMIEEHGWLGKSLVGEDGAEAAWLIAQHGTHAPIEQVKLLPKLIVAANEGEAKMSHYAHLYDLVSSHHRRPQRYGTLRWENPETGEWEIYPIEEPEKVNEYRKEAGLPPLKL